MAGREWSAAFVRAAKPGRYCDGDSLYLPVTTLVHISGYS